MKRYSILILLLAALLLCSCSKEQPEAPPAYDFSETDNPKQEDSASSSESEQNNETETEKAADEVVEEAPEETEPAEEIVDVPEDKTETEPADKPSDAETPQEPEKTDTPTAPSTENTPAEQPAQTPEKTETTAPAAKPEAETPAKEPASSETTAPADNSPFYTGFFGLTRDEIGKKGYTLTQSNSRTDGSSVYEISGYSNLKLVYAPDNSANPAEIEISDSSVETFLGLKAGMAADDAVIDKIVWEDIKTSAENSLYYTSVTSDGYIVTAAWSIPEAMFTEWEKDVFSTLGTEYNQEFINAYQKAYSDFVAQFKNDPVGKIEYLIIKKA